MKSNLWLFLSDKSNKRKFVYLMAMIIFLITFFAITVTYSHNFLSNNAKSEIREKSQLNNKILNERFDNIFDVLYSTSSMISLENDIKSPEVLQKLRQISLKNGFDRMAVTTPDGISYTDDNVIHNSKDRTYFIESMNGKEIVTEIEKSNINGNPFIAFSCPIVKDKSIVGVLRVTISKDFFMKLIDIENLTGSDDVFFIDSSGSVVLINENNIFNKMLKANKKNISAVNKLEQAALNKKEICINYLDGSKKMYAFSVPSGYNDWSIITTLSNKHANNSYHMIYLYIVFFPALFILIIIINLLYCRSSYKQFILQNKVFSKEISIMSKAPSLCIFWYDIKKRKLTFSEGLQELIGCRPSIENIPESLIDNDLIFSEHSELLCDFFERINSGLINNEAYIKIKKPEGEYILFKISSTTIYYNGSPLKAVGYLEKINSDSKQDPDIAIFDSLTGLYNKFRIKNYINDFIKNNRDSIGALLIVDIYNFNLINEKLGYSYGDKVIKDMADQLKSLFRSSDIIARSGDDEFILFMKDVNSMDLLTNKINKIIDSTNKIIPEDESMSVSVNIGVAMFPQDGDDFNELFKNSTTALTIAKRKGGGYFEFYSKINI